VDSIEQLETCGEAYRRGYETGWKDGYAKALKHIRDELNIKSVMLETKLQPSTD
jgi:flagellar biosynthesis/type III secretory pathway protein FliH